MTSTFCSFVLSSLKWWLCCE